MEERGDLRTAASTRRVFLVFARSIRGSRPKAAPLLDWLSPNDENLGSERAGALSLEDAALANAD
jgi:hypothetical protein